MNGPANIAYSKSHTARTALRDDRLDALLGHPVALTILRLAVSDSTVMLVQVLMGLLEVYFIAKLGLDALAGVTLVFPLLALTVAISQGATGGGIVTSVARAYRTRRIRRRGKLLPLVRDRVGVAALDWQPPHSCMGWGP